MGVYGEALQLCAVYKKPYFFTASHVRIRIRVPHSHVCIWMCNKIEGWYDKIIITIVPSYTRKNITCLLPLVLVLMLRTYNSTDGNKLVILIFSCIALYYGYKVINTVIISSKIKWLAHLSWGWLIFCWHNRQFNIFQNFLLWKILCWLCCETCHNAIRKAIPTTIFYSQYWAIQVMNTLDNWCTRW